MGHGGVALLAAGWRSEEGEVTFISLSLIKIVIVSNICSLENSSKLGWDCADTTACTK
jgi:hypothetical protein